MRLTISTFASLLLYAFLAQASTPIPVKLQAALFRKILSYDKNLKNKTDNIVIVLLDESNKFTLEIAAAFESVGFKVVNILPDKLPQSGADFDVLYITPDTPLNSYKELCEQQSLLTITGTPHLVEKGHVSIGLGTKDDGRAQIIVNLKRLRAEKHELLSDLLTLAKVIR